MQQLLPRLAFAVSISLILASSAVAKTKPSQSIKSASQSTSSSSKLSKSSSQSTSTGANANVSSTTDTTAATNAAKPTSKWEQMELRAEQAFIDGDIEGARTYWQDALKQAKSEPGGELNVATTLNQLNHLYNRTGEFENAHQSLLEALSIRTRLLGEEDLLTAETMGNLGLVCHQLHRDDEAEKWFEKALAVKNKHLASDAPELAVTMHNLAKFYGSRKHYDKAHELLTKVHTIDKKHYGEYHIESVKDLTSLGINEFNHQRYQQAIATLEQALKTMDSPGFKGDFTQERISIHHYLGLSFGHWKKSKEAGEHYAKARALGEKLHGEGHALNTVGILNLARNADELGDKDKAESLYMEALSFEEKRKPARDYLLTECCLELGHFYTRHEMSDEAERFFRRALTSFDRLDPHQKRKLYELPVAYSDLLKKLGKTAEAKEISRRYLHVHTPHSDQHFRL